MRGQKLETKLTALTTTTATATAVANSEVKSSDWLDDADDWGSDEDTCDVANNGLEALNMIMSFPRFDYILMDVRMPIMDGIAATEKLRKDLRIGTPIIMLSAEGSDRIKNKAKDAGSNDFIEKPVAMSDLSLLIHKQHNKTCFKQVL